MFEYVATLHRPVQVAALVQRFRLNHNVIRQHLAKLCEADLFVEEFAPRNGPGRPALQYRVADVAVTWGDSSPYEQLALLLLQMTSEGLSAREVGRRAGRRAAMTRTAEPATVLERLVSEMRRRGVETQTLRTSTGMVVVLHPGPALGEVAQYQNIICEILRGLAEGFLVALGGDLKVAPPSTDGSDDACTIKLEPVPQARSGGE